MKPGLLGVLLLLTGLVAACASAPPVPPPVSPPGPSPAAPPVPAVPAPALPPVRPGVAAAGVMLRIGIDDTEGRPQVQSLPLEDYVAGCVAAELGATVDPTPATVRMYEVQAILCRTFAVANLGRHAAGGYDLCSTTHCQLYRRQGSDDLSANGVRDAVEATRGVVVVYEGKPARTFYHAHCGGRTSAADAVWGGRREPYLLSVADDYCPANSQWQFAIERAKLRDLLNRAPRTAVGSRLDRVQVVRRDEAERAATVMLAGTRTRQVSGDEFRATVMREMGPQSLRSARFTVRRKGGLFVFEGSGYGHGVGLCQAGAMARARAGESPEAIIRAYYPGVHLERVAVASGSGEIR